MNKSCLYRSFITTIILTLIILTIPVLDVKAQPTPTPNNWSRVATFTGENSVNTDSFTCNHVEWRIRWEADIMDLHFYFTDYFLQITTLSEGTVNDYIDFINGSFSSISDSGDRVSGTSYIHDNSGSFYMRILTSTHTKNYRVIVEQNTDSPIPTPTPVNQLIEEYRGFNIVEVANKFGVTEIGYSDIMSPLFSSIVEAKEWIDSGPTTTQNPSISPTPTLPPIRFYNPYLILFGTTLLLIGLGILVYIKKFKK